MTQHHADLVARIAANSTYHPVWIGQQLNTWGNVLVRAITTDRYAGVVAKHADRAPLTRLEASGAAFLVVYSREMRQARSFMTAIQFDRFCEFLAILIRADVNARQGVTV